LLERGSGLPDTFWYSTKRKLLGPPLVNQDLGEQRLTKPPRPPSRPSVS
jgi:hypothetical protein